MTFREFKEHFRAYPVIQGQALSLVDGDQAFRNQITRWQKRGLLVKLRKGLYSIAESERTINVSRDFIAGQIYSPSYMSCESALSYYEMIPERVSEIISVTPKKTMRFTNQLGTFSYHHVAQSRYFGYTVNRDEKGFSHFIAEPEKAVLDFLYLNLGRFHKKDREVFAHSYRFQSLEILALDKLREYASRFDCSKLIAVVEQLCEYRAELMA